MDASLDFRPGRGTILPIENNDSEVGCKPGEDVISCTFGLLAEGEQRIALDDDRRDSIVLLGNTGSGKSTLVRFLAGDNTRLISRETEEESGDYIIEGIGIGNATFKSKTVFPALVPDSKRNAAFYDCPGFSDTQGTSHEIAETYFVKKVLDFLDRVKLVFLVNHSSLKKGYDRQDFMKLLRHVTDLVKDIDKFRTSIAMVATKVENKYIRRGKDFVLVGDDKMISAIAGFLKEAKQYLEENSKRGNLSEKEKRFHEQAIKFVEILLEKEGEKYPRIGIFRAPDMPGPVSDIPLLQAGKKRIEEMVHEKLDFTAKSKEDFGYTVSDTTKIDINEIATEINNNLWSRLSIVSEKVQEYCENLVDKIRGKIQLLTSSVNYVDADPSEAKEFRYKFFSAYNSTSELISKMNNLTNPKELAALVNTTTSILKIDVTESDVTYIETQGNYFNFLQTVSDRTLKSKQWNLLFKEVKTFLTESQTIILGDVEVAAKTVVDRIQNRLKDTVKVIKVEYTKEIKILEIQNLSDTLNRDYKFVLQLTSKLKNKITIEKLVRAIDSLAENLKVNFPKENSQIITNQGKYFEFLEKLSDKPLNVQSMAWSDPFLDLGQYFYESGKWYSFLEHLYNKFSEYEIQKDRQRYNVEDLEDWGQAGKPQGIYVTQETFEKFLDKIRNLNVTEYETITKIPKLTVLQREELNQALSLTLRHRPTVRCSDPYITVEGTFIVLQDVMNRLKGNRDTDGSCENFESKLKAGKFDLLKVFSLDRVFIDGDLSFSGNRISVAVIAPKWEVVGARSIDLSGGNGGPPEDSKAKGGARPGAKGGDGVPGNPGVSGETFFGIGSAFEGGASLEIVSNGGKGGRGQDGGDGTAGIPGADALIPSRRDKKCENGNFRGFRCELLEKRTDFWFGAIIDTESFRIYGKSGGRGGRGGNGGRGGTGGHPGKIRIIELDNPSQITTATYEGMEGRNGLGGIGGEEGENGGDIKAEYRIKDTLKGMIRVWEGQESIRNDSKGPPGDGGENGANSVGRKDAVPSKSLGSVPAMINGYKIYLLENMNSRFTRHSLLRFLERLGKSDEVRNAYDILSLIDEFKGLEEQFHKSKKHVDFSIFYDSLLERISEFAKNLEKGPDSGENKKVLNYLYTATRGRLQNLRERSETFLVVDIRKYVNSIEENIKTLRDLETQNNKVEVINKYKERYKEGIDKKTEEATSFIENVVGPEIEKINVKIDGQVDALIDEVIELQKEAETEIQKLEERKIELENKLALKGLFGCLQLVGGVVKLLGPMGRIAGAVVDAANAVGDALALEDQQTPLELPKDIASSIDTISGQMKSMREKKVEFLQKSLDDLSEEIEKNPEKLGDMEGKIKDIKDKLETAGESRLDYNRVKTLANDLNEELERKGVELKSSVGDKKSEISLRVIEKIQKVGEYGTLLLKVYDKYKKEEEKIGAVNDSIKDLQDKLEDLRGYENSIYDTIVPMLNEMMEHTRDVKDKMGTKSKVALDVSKWQVQSRLKDLRLKMLELTEGLSAKDDLSRSIEKLDEVMATLIALYDRIQGYQDQERLADYIGDIGSVAASRIDVRNQTLANAINYLEYVIKANMVMDEYKSALDALEQWVFPFADRYIENSMLPSRIELENNLENLARSASRQIGAIRRKIDLYDASVKSGDAFLHCEEFSSRYVSSEPFLVWNREEFGGLISDLLSGKKTILKADVRRSSPRKDAIKFSEVDFRFRTENETAQSLLSEVLKGFDVRATHFGNSYYRYGGEIFLMVSDSVTISYSYEKNDDGTPIRSNAVYNMLRSGDLSLSPYTLWEVSLVVRSDRYSFRDLEPFKNETDLELSGFGSFVDAIRPADKSMPKGVRSRYRSKRSPHEFQMVNGYLTNYSPKGMSSPINLVLNFLKTFLVSKAIASINQIFAREQKHMKGSDDRIGMREIGSAVVPNTVKVDKNSPRSCCGKKIFEPESATNFGVNTNCLGRISPNDPKDRSVQNCCTRVPDLNCSLLLADLVTRTLTGNKHQPPVAECLLSPRDVILGEMSEWPVRNESDAKQMLLLQQTKKEGRILTSWFDTFNDYAKSVLTYFGFLSGDPSEYAQDIRHLFA